MTIVCTKLTWCRRLFVLQEPMLPCDQWFCFLLRHLHLVYEKTLSIEDVILLIGQIIRRKLLSIAGYDRSFDKEMMDISSVSVNFKERNCIKYIRNLTRSIGIDYAISPCIGFWRESWARNSLRLDDAIFSCETEKRFELSCVDVTWSLNDMFWEEIAIESFFVQEECCKSWMMVAKHSNRNTCTSHCTKWSWTIDDPECWFIVTAKPLRKKRGKTIMTFSCIQYIRAWWIISMKGIMTKIEQCRHGIGDE